MGRERAYSYKYALSLQLDLEEPPRDARQQDEPVHIRQHLDALDTGAAMKQNIRTFLHRIFRKAVDLDMISGNPVSRVRAPKVEHRERPTLTPHEVGYLLRAVSGDRLEALVILALTSTMGPAALLGLRRGEVYLAEGFLMVTGDLVQAPGCSRSRQQRRNIAAAALTYRRSRSKRCVSGKALLLGG